jgi:hypothetical protein
MQTKITIEVDNEVLDSARELAELHSITIDQFINDLIRQRVSVNKEQPRFDPYGLGIRFLPSSKNDRPITMEFVNELRDTSE